jgi:pyridinium-3,5-biscarboxylic acid mononucleotide sulfurtransferase
MACLASRLPYGTPVTAERLTRVGGAESDLRALGLKHFRVRFHGDVARIEVGAEEHASFASPEFRRAVDRAVKARGFAFVALDLEPFRSGRLNDALAPGAPASAHP